MNTGLTQKMMTINKAHIERSTVQLGEPVAWIGRVRLRPQFYASRKARGNVQNKFITGLGGLTDLNFPPLGHRRNVMQIARELGLGNWKFGNGKIVN